MKIMYKIFNENNQFGISAIDSETEEFMLIKDISIDRSFVENLVDKFNTYELSITAL